MREGGGLPVVPQLYSRIGFAHRYRPLSTSELRFVLAHHWHRLGLTLDLEDFTDAEAVSAIARITTGNFRLVHRLLAQTDRILEVNHLHTITAEVVDAARETLVIAIPNELRRARRRSPSAQDLRPLSVEDHRLADSVPRSRPRPRRYGPRAMSATIGCERSWT
jgi:hypothetical protein